MFAARMPARIPARASSSRRKQGIPTSRGKFTGAKGAAKISCGHNTSDFGSFELDGQLSGPVDAYVEK